MPMYDLTCSNNHVQRDRFLRIDDRPPCPECGEPTQTLWNAPPNVIGDDIPGGVLVHHGICHEDGTPRRYYSKSEMALEAKRRGLVNVVRHIGAPGGDRSKHTQRWV